MQQAATRAHHLVWVYPAEPTAALDAATWLEVTRALREAGWSVTLIGMGEDGTHVVHGIEIQCVSSPNWYFLGKVLFHLKLLPWLLRDSEQIDVVLFHQMSFPWMFLLGILRNLLGKRRPLLVMDTRDLYIPGRGLKNRMRVLFENTVHAMANRWADGQTAITRRMAELVNIPARQLWGIWPSGVKLERFAAVPRARRWPQPGEPIRLIYTGILLHQRGLLPLAQAVEQANAEGMRFELLLLGSGSARASLEELASQTSGRVRVIPPVPYSEIPAWLSQAHIGVTSMFPPEQVISQASSPIKLFEYMAAGLPILATRIVCHTDVVSDAPYAFWADDTSQEQLLAALRDIWQARHNLEEKGHLAASAAQEWTWQASAHKLQTALEYGVTQ
jgi:glycosyltransferase involved in cell wall biosynthesis